MGLDYLVLRKELTNKMTTKTYDNSKLYNVEISCWVRSQKTFAEDTFQVEFSVKSPKTGRVLRGVRFDYLNEAQTIYLSNTDGRPTAARILAQFDKAATRKAGVSKYHDELTATIQLTAHDLLCCQKAEYGWSQRQLDYAD
jgi:hypothetical protein